MSEIKRSNLVRGLKISLSISVIVSVILLFRTINVDQLRQMQQINPLYLLLALLLVVLMWMSQGLSMQVLASALDERISLKDGTKNYLVGSFISNVTPFASGGGPFQVFLLHQKGMSLGKASSIITVQWSLRQVFFGILAPVFFFFYRDYIDPGKIPANVFNIAVITGIAITFLLLFFIWKPQVVPVLACGIVRLPGIRALMKKRNYEERFNQMSERAFHEIDIFHGCLAKLAHTRKLEMVLATIFIGLFWSFYFMVAPVILVGLGAQPHFYQAFIMQTIMFLVLPYIPTPGASGAAELGFVACFAPFVPLHILGILAISWRILTYYFSTMFGGMITLRILAKREIA